MAFSIFTTQSRGISTRLKLVARGFQLTGIFAWTVTAFGAVALPFIRTPVHLYRWMFAPPLLYGAIWGASMYLIGRALMRRQRWGALLAGATLGVPFVKQLLKPNAAILSVAEILVTTLALAAIVTVWDELGTVRDTEFIDPDNEDEDQLPTRNRGYGETRSVPRQSMSDFPIANPIAVAGQDPLAVERGS